LKIWIDALTPKHYLMTKALEENFIKDGHEVFVTLREYEELERVYKRIKLESKHFIVGSHGGGDLKAKLLQSGKRMLELTSLIADLKPELSVSFGSPEAARVSFGLNVPHVLICDSPHSVFVCKLTVPLSSYLLTPWIIKKNKFAKYGIEYERIIKYKSLDPTAWLYRKHIWPPKNKIELASTGAIVIREIEYMASYVKDFINFETFALNVASEYPDKKVILLKRYFNVEKVSNNLIIYGGEFFGPNVLENSYAFIGGGGTMSVEAILLGIKTVSVFSYKTDVEEYLLRKGYLRRESDPKKIKEFFQTSKKLPVPKLPDASAEIYKILKSLFLVRN